MFCEQCLYDEEYDRCLATDTKCKHYGCEFFIDEEKEEE